MSDNLKKNRHTTNEKLAIASVNYIRKKTGLNQGLFTLIARIQNDNDSVTPCIFDKSMILAFDPTFLNQSSYEEILKVAFLEAYKAYIYFLIIRNQNDLENTQFSEIKLSLLREEFDNGEIPKNSKVYQLASNYTNDLLSKINEGELIDKVLIKNYYRLY